MKALRERILADGVVASGLVIVDSFINHRTDPLLMSEVGKWLCEHLPPFDLVLTAEASGIPVAFAVATHGGTDFLYAKKQYRRLDGETHLMRKVPSPTKGGESWMTIKRSRLGTGRDVLIIDDFLSQGRTSEALGLMAEEVGNKVVGFGFAIEKSFVAGRSRLESRGWKVVSAAEVLSVANGRLSIA